MATDLNIASRTKQNLKAGDELAPGWGWVKSIDVGADTPIYLALLPPNGEGPKGEFVGERKGKNEGNATSRKQNLKSASSFF